MLIEATDALRAYDRAARDLHETELRIASIGHRAQTGVDSKILPSLIAKRDRLIDKVIELKGAADAAKQERRSAIGGWSHIKFRDRQDFPIGCTPIEDIAGDIPDFLRRVRA